MSEKNQILINEISDKLDASCEQIEPQVRSRLTQMRYEALDRIVDKAASRQTLWLPISAFATASVLAAVIFLKSPITSTPDEAAAYVAVVDDMEILYSNDSLELYENVEFYQWLEDNEASI